MTTASCEAACAAPVDVLWAHVTDLPATAGPVPLTTATGDLTPVALGWSVTARTAVGPLGFDDSMLVTSITPPTETREGSLRLVKTGRLLDGWAEITVVPAGERRSRLVWQELVRPRPHLLRPLASAPGAANATSRLLRLMVDDLVARAESRR